MDLKLGIFRFHLTFQEETKLPVYKGSVLRGGIGAILRHFVCVFKGKNCSDCLLRYQCVYSYVFETPIKDKEKFNTTHLSHPYIIEPDIDGKTFYLPDYPYAFNIILFGNAIDLLPYFVLSVEELGKRGISKKKGYFTLDKVENLYDLKEKKGDVVYNGVEKLLIPNKHIINLSDIEKNAKNFEVQSITIDFLTPCRIVNKNKLINPEDFTFSIFIRAILRRLNLLCHLFDINWKPDYENLLRIAEGIETKENKLYWYDWERFSSRQKTRMKLGGLKGRITYSGDLNPFMPFILMGEYVHIGKDTSFGLGKYEIQIYRRKSIL